jgi:hypothetical protein
MRARGPPTLHGPYPQWTRKVDGKTVTKLFTPEQLGRYGDAFDNDRKLRGLVAQLETLSIDTISDAEGWNHQERTRRRPGSATGALWQP